MCADKGEGGGYGWIGFMYMEGLGVEKCTKTALDYLEKAANLGEVTAAEYFSEICL